MKIEITTPLSAAKPVNLVKAILNMGAIRTRSRWRLNRTAKTRENKNDLKYANNYCHLQ
jgi:hypothetical protein